IVVGEPLRKLVGWGQVRRRGVVLHHAVTSLHFDPAALAGLLAGDRIRLAEALRRRVADFASAAKSRVGSAHLSAALVEAYGGAGLRVCLGRLSSAERARSRALRRE